MLPTLQIGPLALPVPGLIILIGLWVALTLSERRAIQNGISSNVFYNLVAISMGSGVLGARLAYVFQYPAAFQASPVSLISINPRLFDLTAGVVTALLIGIIYGKRKRLELWPTLDVLTPGMAVMGISFGLSHLASGIAFGAPTQLPWGIELWGETRHPSQVYETILAVLILAGVLLLEKSRDSQSRPSGVIFWAFIGMSAASRLFLEAFRGESTLIFSGFRQDQLSAWFVLGVSLFGLYQRLFTPGSTEDTTT